MTIDVIGWTGGGALRILDQTRLPDAVEHRDLTTVDAVVEAIRMLRVRGAPLIGIAGAMGLAAAARAERRATREWLDHAADAIGAARPTAVNLRWAVERARACGLRALDTRGDVVAALHAEAQAIWDEDRAMCEAIGTAGAEVLEPGATVLTICNTGRLATGGIGTALGIVYAAVQVGKGIDVMACETRPLRQGARLTTWELAQAGIPCTVIADGAAGAVMARGDVDAVIVGADRIAANGDVANKIGTYGLAVLARAHGIPFYVAAPSSTIDASIASGDAIPIEERSATELLVARGAEVYNPAFDVTPAELISATITERGVASRANDHG